MSFKNLLKIGGLVFLTNCLLSITNAQINRPTESPEWYKSWTPPSVPADYRSPGEPHKLFFEKGFESNRTSVMSGDPIAQTKLGPLNVYQYVGRNLYLLKTVDFDRLVSSGLGDFMIRDDMNLIRLRDRYFDTTIPVPEVDQNLKLVSSAQNQLHLVQFVGPVQNDWLTALNAIEGLTIVTHMPENAYLIWANEKAREHLKDLVVIKPFFQWEGPFHHAYRLHPAFDLAYSGEVTATIQMLTHAKTSSSITKIKNKASDVLRDTYQVGQYTNIVVKVSAAELINITKLEDVVNVEPWIEPTLLGERQGQIIAGNLNAAGDGPAGPGYFNWLNGLGFNQNFDFVVDVTDDGFDQGQTGAANVHEDFLDAAGNSRVAYVRRIAGTTVTTTNDANCGGHGTINASIVGGQNQTPATNPDIDYYRDADGYYFGLGVAPFVRLGSSKIFNSFYLYPDFTTLIDRAYTDGARISSNSWGTRGNGSYSAVSQEYDNLVRDSRPLTAPSGGTEGNQEMVIVFAAGNEGPNARTLGEGGPSAKNTITVGASENLNDTGDADGCNPGGCCDDNDADDIRDIAVFSSRGPADQINGRVKPDIVAPGTHISGAASQDACFDGSSVCGDTDNNFAGAPDDAYYPDDPDATDTRDQDLYTWSSGTSHSCPAVSGGAALLRQWFLNQGFPAPSPSMTKAYLLNSTTYMTGTGANDDLPSNNQGMGRMNLGLAFDNTNRLIYDQVKTCYRNSAVDVSEVFTINGQVADNTRPFRVTLAWTDAAAAPGAGDMISNDLDLVVDVGGAFYRGNNFTNATSNISNIADPPDDLNNVESVFLPAGTAGNFTISVRPSGINSDALEAGGTVNRQDFSLVVYNGEFPPRNPVDIILVLDRSGSMNSIAAGGTVPKIDLLKDAVEMFIRTWFPFSIPQDRMGIVYFNNTITKYPNTTTTLLPFQSHVDSLISNVRDITATGCTGLGAGILAAKRGFDTGADRQRHIIVFTNGMQNCSPMVSKQGGAHQILDDPSPGCCTVLGVPDEPGVNLSDYGVKAIHTIGAGVSSAQWINLLADITGETGGRMRFTSTPDEDLEDFFLETLVEALRVDPVEKVKTVSGNLLRNQLPVEKTFSINSSVRKATFILTWQGDRNPDALDLELMSPSGTSIPTGLLSIKEGAFYRLASMDFPLDLHGTPINHSGTWKLIVKPQFQMPQVSYRAHLIIDDMDMRYHFELPVAEYGVGEAIPLSFWAQHGNRTITNLTDEEVTVTIQRPPMGFGNFMVKHDVSKAQLDQLPNPFGDKYPSLAAKKGHILYEDDELRQELNPFIDHIALYDDGNPGHGDLKANDGVYSALYKNTVRPGLYNFKFEATGTEVELGKIHRTEFRSMTVGIKQFDFSKSTILLSEIELQDVAKAYQIELTLIDKYGNYLGPGHAVNVIVDAPGKRWGPSGKIVPLDDNLDGSYSGIIELTENEVSQNAILILDVNGNTITSVQAKSTPSNRFGISLHSGLAVPSGNFSNSFDQGVNYLLDLNFWLRHDLALFAFLGYNDFKSNTLGINDNPVWNISLNIRYYRPFSTMPGTAWKYYLGGGPGYYIPNSGNNDFGINLEAGINYRINPNLSLELGADYHKAIDVIEFIHTHAGIIFNF